MKRKFWVELDDEDGVTLSVACEEQYQSGTDINILVHVDPYGHLAHPTGRYLARILAKAMNDAGFRPKYRKEP